MDASVAFVGSGATVGVVLGSSILVTRRGGLRDQRWLALMLVVVSAAMIAITLRHASEGLAGGALLDLVEYCTALASGPLFAGYIRSRFRGTLEMRPALLVHFLPAAAAAVQIAASGEALVPFRFIMLVQFAYTAVALREIVSAHRSGVAAEALRWPSRLVGLVVLINAAQVVRTLFFELPQLRNVVPITAVIGLQLLAILAFRESILRSPAGRTTPSRTRTPSTEDAALAAELDVVMERERLWADADLNLERLVRAAGSTAHRVSSALNAERGGFFEYVTSWRLDAVRAALENPENDIYTIDALAERAGFRSRSTFYASFRRKFGVTPSQVRRRI